MKSTKELKAIKLTLWQEKIRKNFVFNTLTTVLEINQRVREDRFKVLASICN